MEKNKIFVKFIPIQENKDDINKQEHSEQGFRRNSRLYSPEWDFDIIRIMYNTESYFRRAVDKYVELVLGNDIRFVSLNENAANFIEFKFREFCDYMDMSLDEFFEAILRELILYANCFIVWQYKTINKIKHHIGFRILPAPDVKLEWNTKTKKITGYYYYGQPNDINRTQNPIRYSASVVTHLKIFKHAGNFFGKPFVIPVLDDIRALRKLEEALEKDAFTFGNRFIHCKISTEDQNVFDADIERIARDLSNVSEEGIFVSSDKITFDPIRVDTSGIDLLGYLEYFKQRVFSGLGTSAVGMGEGQTANRGTAIVLDKQTENMAKIFSSGLNREVQFHIIRRIFRESGLYKWKPENKVKLALPAINIDEKIKIENHVAQMYAQYLLTETEARTIMDRRPLTDRDRKDMFFERVAKPIAIIRAVDEPYLQPTLNQGKNKDQPENQYQKKLAPTIPANDVMKRLEVVLNFIGDQIIENWDLIFQDKLNFEDESIINLIAKFKIKFYELLPITENEIINDFLRKFLCKILKIVKLNEKYIFNDTSINKNNIVKGVLLSGIEDLYFFLIGGSDGIH